MTAELNIVQVLPVTMFNNQPKTILERYYSETSHRITDYLTTLRRPNRINKKEFRAFQKRAIRYQLRENHLFRRRTRNTPTYRIINSKDERTAIKKALYNKSNHRNIENTITKISNKY